MPTDDRNDSSKKSSSSPFDIFLNKNKGGNDATPTTSANASADCDRPACEDTVSALTSAFNRLNKKNKGSSSIASRSITNSNEPKAKANGCPPSKDHIGTSSWTLLHSMVSLKRFFIV